jgi:twitching motility protein PilI
VYSQGAQTLTSAEALFAALRDLDGRCREHAAGLPHEEKAPVVWAGILFRVGQVALLAQLAEIAEVLEFPQDATPVPATKPWVRGVANNRGTLLPIFDLRGLLFDVPTTRNPKNRVLVARDAEVPFGLLVSDVAGIRRFDAAAAGQDLPDAARAIRPFIEGSFLIAGERCPVFSLRRMAQDERLASAAA